MGCHFLLQRMKVKSAQSCPTLCDPMDCSPPGSPVPGILQARALQWGAIAGSFPFHGYSTNSQMRAASLPNWILHYARLLGAGSGVCSCGAARCHPGSGAGRWAERHVCPVLQGVPCCLQEDGVFTRSLSPAALLPPCSQ